METKEFKLSEGTRRIAELYMTQSDLLNKIADWYEEEYGSKDNEELNDSIMSNFWDKLYGKASDFLSYLLKLYAESATEHLLSNDGLI